MTFRKISAILTLCALILSLFSSCSSNEDDELLKLGTFKENNQLRVELCWVTPISCGVKVNVITPFTSLIIASDYSKIEDCNYYESDVSCIELQSSQYDFTEDKICGCDCLFSLQPNTTYYIRAIYTPNEQGKPTQQWQKGEILTVTTPTNDFWGNEMVDMGNNKIWRNCNLGAAAPYECGSYYFWGATETVKYVNGSYTPSVPKIFLNNICGTEYDASTKLLGKDWQMPTYSDVYDLINSCSITKIWADRIIYDFKSNINGAHLYIPASGYGAFSVNEWGTIKSAELDNDNDVYLPFCWIGNMADDGDYRDCLKGDKIGHAKRYYSLPIRPIYIQK